MLKGSQSALVGAILRNLLELRTLSIDRGSAKEITIVNKVITMTQSLERRLEEPFPEVRCCFCGIPATARFIFVGANDKVVDNPFCSDHERVVYEQTHRSMKVIYRKVRNVYSEITAIQRWGNGSPPVLPSNKYAVIQMAGYTQH